MFFLFGRRDLSFVYLSKVWFGAPLLESILLVVLLVKILVYYLVFNNFWLLVSGSADVGRLFVPSVAVFFRRNRAQFSVAGLLSFATYPP